MSLLVYCGSQPSVKKPGRSIQIPPVSVYPPEQFIPRLAFHKNMEMPSCVQHLLTRKLTKTFNIIIIKIIIIIIIIITLLSITIYIPVVYMTSNFDIK